MENNINRAEIIERYCPKLNGNVALEVYYGAHAHFEEEGDADVRVHAAHETGGVVYNCLFSHVCGDNGECKKKIVRQQ